MTQIQKFDLILAAQMTGGPSLRWPYTLFVASESISYVNTKP